MAFSCVQGKTKKSFSINKIENKHLQVILDSSKVDGVILIYDYQKNKFYSNNFLKAKEAALPASTFKIPNSIIGLETGVIKEKETIFKWDAKKRALSIWEKDLNLKEAFQKSCVPCYQEVARNIGAQKMNNYLKKLKFGKMDVNDKNIDTFWLIGKSKISPFQQIDFLSRLYNKQLGVSESTNKAIRDIMIIKKGKNYTLSAKTGLSIRTKKIVAWFVGFIEKKGNIFFFATKISPKSSDMSMREFSPIRKRITISALKKLKIIE